MNTGNNQVQNAVINATQIGSLIEPDEFAEYMESSALLGRLDLGSSLINKVMHPALGALLLISTDSGAAALIRLM
jgi:hypothetical protein